MKILSCLVDIAVRVDLDMPICKYFLFTRYISEESEDRSENF